MDQLERIMMFRDGIQRRAGFISICCVLIATFVHNVQFMSGFFYSSMIFGAIAATGVDAGIIAIAIAKDKFLSKGENAYGLRAFAIALGLLTALGNADASFVSKFGTQMTSTSIASLDWLVMLKWAAVSLGFPASVFIAGDIMSVRYLFGIAQSNQQRHTVEYEQIAQTDFYSTTTLFDYFNEYHSRHGSWPTVYDVQEFNRIVKRRPVKQRAAYSQRATAIKEIENVRKVSQGNGQPQENINAL